ncbi:two-component response regulator-like APRR1 isoform X2 [Rutidosis leptorrhynchoides]|uniref:two-component response regulator-like APRR1 isoform X2 n=1 Tax=Rutidosis leptorrhynchoides TaxID=125765 RepID=UPI003A99677B
MWKMDPNEIMFSRGGNSNGKTGEGFIDRSKVRILLCDNDIKSSQEVFTLLCKCSYQVTSVRSPRQVIDALNAEGPDIDIILSEVDLPMAKGFKMLKYIMRDKDLRRIPVIMMSAQDEVALVVKCLRLGAADYLVKPLRTNELLNLWTHMWRRRRMLGLAEKNIMHCDFDLVHSDPSDANTNSTTMFSDDTDDNKSLKSSNPEVSMANPRESEINNMIIPPRLMNTPPVTLSDDRPNVPEINEQQRGKTMFGPKKSELKIGQSSAFFTYVKSSVFTNATGGPTVTADETMTSLDENNPLHHNLNDESATQYDYTQAPENIDSNNSFPDSMSVDKSSTPSLPPDAQNQQAGNNYNYHHDFLGYNAYSGYPHYYSGPMNHVMMNHNMHDLHNQFNHIPHCPPNHLPGIGSFPYYPINLCLPGQMAPAMHPWPTYGNTSNNVNVHKLDHREAALLKFRQKRKERCFDKKIRYVNRKKLAERRPRVKGQFVRKINGINVDLNGQPTSADFDEDDDDEEDEDQVGRDSSPENNYEVFN